MNFIKKATLVGVAAVALATAGSPSYATEEPSPPVGRMKIATNYVRENGCHEKTLTFTTQVPNVDRLDRSYHGKLDGLEIVESGNGTRALRNVTWVNATTISYQLSVKGAGFWVDPPKVFGTRIGGGYCHGAAGASLEVSVYAHYR